MFFNYLPNHNYEGLLKGTSVRKGSQDSEGPAKPTKIRKFEHSQELRLGDLDIRKNTNSLVAPETGLASLARSNTRNDYAA